MCNLSWKQSKTFLITREEKVQLLHQLKHQNDINFNLLRNKHCAVYAGRNAYLTRDFSGLTNFADFLFSRPKPVLCLSWETIKLYKA